jgi:hypothetical protein
LPSTRPPTPTQDAFYSSVSAAGLVDAVESLRAGGAPPRLVIIDDGWQLTDLDGAGQGLSDSSDGEDGPASRRRHSGRRSGGPGAAGGGSGAESEDDAFARESFVEGEAEALSAMLRAIPEGSATGRILQEVKAADGAGGGESDAALVRAIAQQHAAHAPAEDTAAGDAEPDGAKRRRTRVGPARRARRGRRPFVVSVTGALLQYGWGVVVGAFQALVLLFYQWVVDPAADGEWPVRLFAAAASGPLRQQASSAAPLAGESKQKTSYKPTNRPANRPTR